jgi:putative CocE/NonD family hydrolase
MSEYVRAMGGEGSVSVLRPFGVRYVNDTRVPMRDGVTLSADLYLPDGGDGPWPTLLARTPYDNNLQLEQGVFWAQHGYAYVAQDVRGRYDSDGAFVPWIHETDDAADTLDWLGDQPWCDGKVGMSGGSYLGQVQWQAAFTGHPLLKAIAPRVIGANLHDSPHYQGGAFGLGVNATWGWRTMGRSMQRIDPFDWPRLLRTLPLRDVDAVSGKRHPAWRDWIAHPDYDDYWRQLAVSEHYEHIGVPVFQVGGWYDLYAAGTMENFVGMRERGATPLAREHQRVVMGPWTHTQAGSSPPGTTHAGERDFGADSLFDTRAMELAWFDRWLKGKQAETAEAPITLFVMGANRWRDEWEWPLARTVWTPMYLHSGGQANSLRGDGTLSTVPPGDEPPDEFVYDPAHPVATLGGCNCCNPEVIPWGVYDQLPIEVREDILVYTTAPLPTDMEVTGPIIVRLFAATDGPDTDFTAKLVDVFPDGTAYNLCDGIIRGRYSASPATSQLLEPGRIYEFEIDLWVTANVFKAGHAIRLEVSSSNFPRFDRNPNTGGPFGQDAELRVARQQVFHDVARASHLMLPVIPSESD